MSNRDPLAGLRGNGALLSADAVVPSDTAAIIPPGYIYVGTGGNVTVRAVGSENDVTYKNLADGSYIGVLVQFVRQTGTTAADMIVER